VVKLWKTYIKPSSIRRTKGDIYVAEEMRKDSSYVLFAYLRYFWLHRKWFLLIPGILIVIAILAGWLQPTTYTGKATLYVDNINEGLNNTDLVQERYKMQLPPELRAGLEVIVPQSSQIQIVLTGRDKQKVEQGFAKIITAYQQELERSYDEYDHALSNYYEAQANYVATLQKALDQLKPATENHIRNYTEDIRTFIEGEYYLSLARQQLELLRTNLNELKTKRPQLIKSDDKEWVKKNPSPMIPNITIAIALGLLLTVIALLMKKYISEMKREISS
jgi:hypothetical protein